MDVCLIRILKIDASLHEYCVGISLKIFFIISHSINYGLAGFIVLYKLHRRFIEFIHLFKIHVQMLCFYL